MSGSRLLSLSVVVCLLAMFALGGCKRRPTPEQCQDMCWKFNELNFWDTFEEETKDLGPKAKEKARAERMKLWEEIKNRSFDPGLKNCITACKRGGEVDQVPCMEKAETAAAARVCFK